MENGCTKVLCASRPHPLIDPFVPGGEFAYCEFSFAPRRARIIEVGDFQAEISFDDERFDSKIVETTDTHMQLVRSFFAGEGPPFKDLTNLAPKKAREEGLAEWLSRPAEDTCILVYMTLPFNNSNTYNCEYIIFTYSRLGKLKEVLTHGSPHSANPHNLPDNILALLRERSANSMGFALVHKKIAAESPEAATLVSHFLGDAAAATDLDIVTTSRILQSAVEKRNAPNLLRSLRALPKAS